MRKFALALMVSALALSSALAAEMPQPTAQPATRAATQPAAQSAAQTPPAAATTVKVEMYGTSWCGYCKKARSFFVGRKIPFIEYDVEKDEQAYRRFRQMNPQGGVPFVLIGGKYGVSGYQEKAYLQGIELSLEESTAPPKAEPKAEPAPASR